jgi:hypothetical protein
VFREPGQILSDGAGQKFDGAGAQIRGLDAAE